MKIFIKLFTFLAFLSVFAIACNDNSDIVEDGGDLLVDNPLDYIHPMESVTLDSKIGEFDFSIFENNGIVKRENCPAYEHAVKQLRKATYDCEYDDLYCGYLMLWWRMESTMSAIKCGLPLFCESCTSVINDVNITLPILIANGLHPDYVQSIEEKLAELMAVCATCG